MRDANKCKVLAAWATSHWRKLGDCMISDSFLQTAQLRGVSFEMKYPVSNVQLADPKLPLDTFVFHLSVMTFASSWPYTSEYAFGSGKTIEEAADSALSWIEKCLDISFEKMQMDLAIEGEDF